MILELAGPLLGRARQHTGVARPVTTNQKAWLDVRAESSSLLPSSASQCQRSWKLVSRRSLVRCTFPGRARRGGTQSRGVPLSRHSEDAPKPRARRWRLLERTSLPSLYEFVDRLRPLPGHSVPICDFPSPLAFSPRPVLHHSEQQRQVFEQACRMSCRHEPGCKPAEKAPSWAQQGLLRDASFQQPGSSAYSP